MNLEETRAYIAYRLKRSGGRPELFTPDAVEMVFRLSRGIPRSINLTCDSALIYGFAEEELVINREVVAKAAKQLALMGLVNIEDAAGAAPGEASAPAVKCDGDAASTQNQAFNAILFFYKEVLGQPLQNIDALRVRRPAQLRHAPSIPQTQALLQTVRDVAGYPTHLIVRLLYRCGLRVSEPLNLRIKDLDLQHATLELRGAKGGNDRVVSLPPCLLPELAQQVQLAKAVWQQDRRNGVPLVLPTGLARKYPDWQFAWSWAWVFPAHHPCRHPRTGQLVRYRMHEANVQRAVKQATRRLGLSILPHELRKVSS